MNHQEFKNIFEEFITREKEILSVKNADYVVGDDKLWNFKTQAQIQGIRPSEVALTFLLKHILSVIKAVRSNDSCLDWYTPTGGEGLKQHIADARNYLVLLYCCLLEEQ